MSDYDELTQRLIERAEKDMAPQVLISHASDRLELKERQLRELAEAMRRLDPRNSAIEDFEREAAAAAAEAKAYREKTLKEMQQAAEEEKERFRKERAIRDGQKTEKLK